jgi:hypothetical protein
MASAAFLNKLEKGQILRAKIEEIQSSSKLLCNFQGELLLIGNNTGKVFHKNEPIHLQVLSVHPLQFQIFTNSGQFQRVI